MWTKTLTWATDHDWTAHSCTLRNVKFRYLTDVRVFYLPVAGLSIPEVTNVFYSCFCWPKVMRYKFTWSLEVSNRIRPKVVQ